MKKIFLFLAFVATQGLFAQNATSVVTPVNPQGWGFISEGVPGMSSGGFVQGPAPTPLGSGSAMLSTTGLTGGHILATVRYAGLRLADMTTVKYSNFGNLTPQSIAFQFDVDSDLTDTNTAYQGRLVFEPYLSFGNSAVVPNTWTEWNVLQGKVWGSGSGPMRPFSNYCPQSNPCSVAQVLVQFPNLGVRSSVGALLFKAGSGWSSSFTGNVDKFTIGTSSGNTTWDFELYSTPTDKDECKNDGFLLFNPPGGPYKNQGQCVSDAVSKNK